MLDALAEHFPAEATWTRPEGGLFIWATLPDYIDTTDLLARALRENVAFVPGRAAYLDGRGGSSMRLNFSGVTRTTSARACGGSARSWASRWRSTGRSPAPSRRRRGRAVEAPARDEPPNVLPLRRRAQ